MCPGRGRTQQAPDSALLTTPKLNLTRKESGKSRLRVCLQGDCPGLFQEGSVRKLKKKKKEEWRDCSRLKESGDITRHNQRCDPEPGRKQKLEGRSWYRWRDLEALIVPGDLSSVRWEGSLCSVCSEEGERKADVHCQPGVPSCGLTVWKIQSWEHMNEDLRKGWAHRARCLLWASPFSARPVSICRSPRQPETQPALRRRRDRG